MQCDKTMNICSSCRKLKTTTFWRHSVDSYMHVYYTAHPVGVRIRECYRPSVRLLIPFGPIVCLFCWCLTALSVQIGYIMP